MARFHTLGRNPCTQRIQRRLMPQEPRNPPVLVLRWKLLHAFWVGIGIIPYRPPAHALPSLLKQPSPACCLPRLHHTRATQLGIGRQGSGHGVIHKLASALGGSQTVPPETDPLAAGPRTTIPIPQGDMSRVFALMGSRVRVHKPLGTAGLHGRRGYLLVHLLIPLRLSTLARELPGAPALPHRWGREKANSRSLPT